MKYGTFARNRNYELFRHPWHVEGLFCRRQERLDGEYYDNCGTAILYLLTGKPPREIDSFNPVRGWYPFATMVRFLQKNKALCKELTRGFVTSEPYDWCDGPIDSDHVILASCLVDTIPRYQEASWFLIAKGFIFHGKECALLKDAPLFFVNRPIQKAWIVKIPKPKGF